MRVLFFDWTTFGDCDIVDAISQLGHDVLLSKLKPKLDAKDDLFVSQCRTLIAESQVELVFTSNFIPVVATACYQCSVKYAAWVYDSPQLLLYNQEIAYPTNYVFLFDSKQYADLHDIGIDTVYYLPLAVNAKRLDELVATKEQKEEYTCEVAFVGALYNEEHNFYDRMKKRLSEYDQGYIEALMRAQQNIYGYFFLEDILHENPILEQMEKAMPYAMEKDSFASKEYCYGNYFLGRKTTSNDRLEKLGKLQDRYQVNVYTTGDLSQFPRLCDMGCVEYFEQMPLAFRHAKINLNISLRTIQNGIPLRCFDIMGSGGFLLTNYQADFEGLFEPEVDYVYYESTQDMLDKIEYYLTHEDERCRIAKHGHDTVAREHTFARRMKQIFETIKEKHIDL